MIGQVLEYADLQKLCRPKGPAPRLVTVERWARRMGLRFRYDNQGGIFTTVDALNAALGLDTAAANEARQYTVDDVPATLSRR